MAREQSTPRSMFYPTSCQSAFCGGGGSDCDSCRNGDELRAFRAWRDKTAAVRPDWIWSPTYWEATRIDGPGEVR